MGWSDVLPRNTATYQVIGRVASTLAAGQQYFILGKAARDLEGCKGGTLASVAGPIPSDAGHEVHARPDTARLCAAAPRRQR
jgi:hypothetical protein